MRNTMTQLETVQSTKADTRTGSAFLVTLVTAGIFGLILLAAAAHAQTAPANQKEKTMTEAEKAKSTAGHTAIRPFRVNIPEAQLTELRRRAGQPRPAGILSASRAPGPF